MALTTSLAGVSIDIWEAFALPLPRERPKTKGGRPRCDDHLALASIIFVLRSGIPCKMLPSEFGCSGMACWRRLRDWQTAGAWARLHRVLLEWLSDAGHLDWSCASFNRADINGASQRSGSSRQRPSSAIAGDPALPHR
ncbi:transposase [Paracoccus benzoatiresistens]|uniref:transposase n=1 Tax=Paracoccus benzoatiresistens TaxID=2997341 RepID=UPI00352FF614